jgi:hypothetical protein
MNLAVMLRSQRFSAWGGPSAAVEVSWLVLARIRETYRAIADRQDADARRRRQDRDVHGGGHGTEGNPCRRLRVGSGGG